MTAWARAIKTGWVVDGAVPGPDVDEFAEPAEVAAALAGTRKATLLAVQHPHRTPEARARQLSLAEALPGARRTLDELLATAYHQVHDVVAVYEVAGRAIGVLCLIDPAAVDEQVRHSEQVYPDIVAERAAMLTGLGRATSAAMLVPVGDGAELTAAAGRAVAGQPPAVSTPDSHRLWLLGPGPAQDELLDAVRRRPLLVADGNHRVAAAAAAGSPLLALVTAGPHLRIGAIHRTLVGTGLTSADLAAAWRRTGLVVHEAADPAPPREPGTVTVPPNLVVDLPASEGPLPRIDHAVVEDLLIADALGLDPGGPHVRVLPEGHDPGPDADAVLQLAPVPLADVLAVHEQGRLMPRKSTYFTPKPRSGLLVADLTG
ncbi:DUF1015 family protein [Amycolatopsis acidiphila]|uniref:DUF1015 domain-containing protein n=1 Tax=Amycolatopsis acidiphila TaxID=715473 RepID=A0A558AEA4_9PSEU|nr:DUF1015 family protein [Amycolatopsis acidiphila]TVT22553.1 DUF1015 domain-containing protein [Amycolatopsis acidiphila]UIJ58810.1 DUF1015 family protein [Amycolatopsis acidiphila]GHG72103.1 hypothetical protein GCM10017788_34330 [Amycolatopsis acidiphila]